MIITDDGQPLEIEVVHHAIDIQVEQSPAGLLLVPVAGRDGTSIRIEGTVATYAALPSGLGAGDRGALYVVTADGLGYVWSGSAWPSDGDGIEIRGPQGETGPKGDTGDTGPKGDKGDTGATGPANVLSIGTVTGGAEADASITGTTPAQVLNLVLPKGDTGEMGPKGDTGDPGEVSTAQLNAALADKADLVGGVIPTGQIPAIALTSAHPVADEAAMLALTGVQPGDLAVRADGGGTWVLTASDPSLLASWLLLNAPTDVVVSVNGRVGTVVLDHADVGAAADDDARLSDARTPTAHTHPATQISDSTTVGRSVLTAANATAARSAIGAGTSSLAIGTTSSTAARGDLVQLVASLPGSPVAGILYCLPEE